MKTSELVSENLIGNRQKLFAELLEGEENAAQLRILLENSDDLAGHELDSFRELAWRISTSFADTLFKLRSCCDLPFVDSTQISSDGAELPEKRDATVFKERRGCHKRRKGAVSWIKVCRTTVDCYAWRKYGQKNIMNNKYPRCYFRCTYKLQGCKALRQVQRLDHALDLYHITYFNHHTCEVAPVLDPLPVDMAIDQEPGMFGFTENFLKKQESSTNPSKCISSIREEANFSDANSALDQYPWQDRHMGMYKATWASSREDHVVRFDHSSVSTSLQGLDMEDNQFDGINCLF